MFSCDDVVVPFTNLGFDERLSRRFLLRNHFFELGLKSIGTLKFLIEIENRIGNRVPFLHEFDLANFPFHIVEENLIGSYSNNQSL